MKKNKYLLLFIFLLYISTAYCQEILTGESASRIAPYAELVRTSRYSAIPDYIRFQKGREIYFTNFITWLREQYKLSGDYDFKLLDQQPDMIGFIHYRYQETYKGLPLQGTMYIVHVRNEKVVSMNGMIFNNMPSISNAALSEKTALNSALNYMNGTVYKWQIPVEEQQLKQQTANPNATWFPKGKLVLAPAGGIYKAENYKLAYCFDIYCNQPLKRQNVFVDAQTGRVINSVDRIDDSNVLGTAVTAYSGTRKINTDSVSSKQFTLYETKRGNGIETYNLQKDTLYTGAVSFTNTTDTWNQVDANLDQYATDAHWGAERTYDFYDSTYKRNSIDNAGFEIFNYVHYGVNYENAFWDGSGVSYGDGGGGYKPFTSIDICAHELTHGVTEYTCALEYQANESGALNESLSDCGGMAVENFAKGTTDWLIGSEVGTPLRSLKNPKANDHPNTYLQQYWYTGQSVDSFVHFNCGVPDFCFYIMSEGDTGKNDNNDSYSVQGIGIKDAHAILYRAQNVYLFPNSQFTDARFYEIQSAIDLFGGCSPEEIATTNAWYAVGVGAAFSNSVTSTFEASITNFCSLPDSVFFSVTSTNGQSFSWNFGDNTTDTGENPVHIYTKSGTYTVVLTTTRGTCGNAATTETNYISIVPPVSPVLKSDTICTDQSVTLTTSGSGNIEWYNAATDGKIIHTGTSYKTPVISTTTTYYVEDSVTSTQEVGPIDNTIGTGEYFPYNYHYEIFNSLYPCTLISVVVFADASGQQTIYLTDSAQDVLDSVSVNTVSGTNTITLNFPLPVENNLELSLSATSDGGLYRNDAGASYPYTINDIISITGNDVALPGYYYFFYDWQVERSCVSGRTSVTVELAQPIAGFTYLSSGLTVNFTNTSSDAISYKWNFGDKTAIDTSRNPSHVYNADGTDTVTLIASYGICSYTTYKVINLISTGIAKVSLSIGINVFPNPFSDNVKLNIGVINDGAYNLNLVDLLGQVILSNTLDLKAGENDLMWNLSSLPAGMYFIQLQSNITDYITKIEKQQ